MILDTIDSMCGVYEGRGVSQQGLNASEVSRNECLGIRQQLRLKEWKNQAEFCRLKRV